MVLSLILILLQSFQPRYIAETTLTESSDTLISQAWTVEEGLPVNTVNSMVQDKNGYIWFTTYDGIVRFDGINFKIYNHANTAEMPQNRAVFMHLQENKGIWVTLENGGVILIDEEERFTHFDEADGFTSWNTTSMMEDSQHRMWFSTFNGLYLYENEEFTRVIQRDSPEKNRISFTYEDTDSTIWVATHDGLIHIKNGKKKIYNVNPGQPENEFRRVQRYESGELLVSALKGLYVMGEDGLYIPKKFQLLKNDAVPYLYKDDQIALISTDIGLYKYNGSLSLLKDHDRSNSFYWTFYRSSENVLWMISTHGEILQMKNGEIFELNNSDILPNHYYNNLLEDREKNIWLATARNGLLRVKNSQVKTIGKAEGLSGNNILGLFEDSRGRFWVGTRDFGLNVIDGNTITQYREADILNRDIVHTINEDHNGNIWVGYYQGGVDRFGNAGITPYDIGFGAGVNDVRSIFVHSDSTIWLGTYGGLVKFDPTNKNHLVYTTKDGLSSELIRYIDEGPKGGLWIGTMSGGVNHFIDGSFTSYTTKDGLASNNIRSVYVDKEDPSTVWVGTENNGLSRIRDGNIESVSVEDGLPNHVIHYISQDHLGWLWMSSNHGVFKISKSDLNSYMDGNSDFFDLVYFGKDEGMRNPEANGSFQQGGLKTSNGTFWFSTQHGVAVFKIDPQQTNTVPPTVLISGFETNGRTYSPDSINFAPGTEAFEVSFKALTFVSPENTRFRYRLEGYETDWNEVINQRTARYANISPGNYTFRVTASNNDGIWNEDGASASFSIKPVFYQQPWFYILIGILIVAGYYPVSQIRYRYLMRQQEKLKEVIEKQTAQLRKEKNEIEEQSKVIKEQSQELEESNKTKDRFFSLIAHDLRNPFQAILGYSEMLTHDIEKADREELKTGLEHIHRSSKSLLTLVEHLLNWASLNTGKIKPDPEPVNLRELLERTHQLFEHIAKQKNIELSYQAEDDIDYMGDLNMLQTMLRNITSNAIKFTQKNGTVSLNLYRKNENNIIEIKDDGIGMPQKLIDKLLQLDANTSRIGTNNEKGSGLGLLICMEMVHLHNGDIFIDSKEGEGTTFTIVLPAEGLKKKPEEIDKLSTD